MSVSRLRSLRQKSGISVRELARQIGEQPTNVSFWERTGKLPRADVLVPIARTLGVTVEDLLGEARSKRSPVAGGRLGALVAQAAKLPRREQQKIAEVLEALIVRHNGSAAAH